MRASIRFIVQSPSQIRLLNVAFGNANALPVGSVLGLASIAAAVFRRIRVALSKNKPLFQGRCTNEKEPRGLTHRLKSASVVRSPLARPYLLFHPALNCAHASISCLSSAFTSFLLASSSRTAFAVVLK